VEEFRFEIGPEDDGKRVDQVLARRVPGMSRARAKAMSEAGEVRVGGRRVRKSHLLRAGDVVSLERLPPRADFEASPDPSVELEILAATEDYVVVEKPAGVPSHPLRPDERGTVAGALLLQFPEMRGLGYSAREPGILHRLDVETSGLILAARNAEAFRALREQLRSGAIRKHYLALCAGQVEAPQRIALPIANDPMDSRKVSVVRDRADDSRKRRGFPAKDALSEVLQSRRVAGFSLVEIQANHARRHQVRVHCASIGHPLAGDRLYGGPAVSGLDRHFLHASRIEFADPRTGESVSFSSELPPDLQEVVRRLEQEGA
jgi:23S rRNA pseudouridine1911/1915/1917 synthase